MRFWIASWFAATMLLVGAALTWGAPPTNTIPFAEASGCCGLPILLVHATHQGNVHDDFAAEQKAKREAEDADAE